MELPIELRIVENTEDKSLVNLACGPYFLAAVSDSKDFLTLPRLDQFKAEEKPFHFTAEGVEFLPFPEVDLEPQHLYFKR